MKVAIVGASGAVGQEFMRVLEEQNFPLSELELYGSHRSAGRVFTFKGRDYVVKLLEHNDDFRGTDIAFVGVGASTSREFASTITKHGTIMIDNSSAFRMDDDVPLVVPEVNGADALNAPRGIIANPNCTTIIMVVALKPIHDLSPIKRIHVASYQAASGAGHAAMTELAMQYLEIATGTRPTVKNFQHQLAYNVIPHIDTFQGNDYTREEMKMFYETRKIMHSDEIATSATCVRVPVMRTHSEAIWVETESPVTAAQARNALRNAPGVIVVDDPQSNLYPMPIDCTRKDPVYVGRIREDLANPCGLTLWVVGDQIKKGAALNAVQIGQYLIDHRR